MKENDILQAQDVRFRYDTEQPNFAVDGVSMEVHRGEFVAVLGANGCGKSHYGRCAKAPEWSRQYRIILSADTASEVRQMPSQKRR